MVNAFVVHNRWLAGPTVCLLAIVVAVGMVMVPLATFPAVVAATAVGCGLVLTSRLQRYWLVSLGVLLVGYAMVGKGFAYLGIPPLFVGEAVIGFGLLAVVLTGAVGFALRSPLVWCWVLLAVVGFGQTVPYLGVYGVDAVRDAAVWGYGVVALIVAAFLNRSQRLGRVPEWYGRVLPWFLLWMPCALVIQAVASAALPRLPISGMPILNIKSGDAAVHLAGAAAFLLVGLHELSPQRSEAAGRPWKEWVLWTLWLAGVGLTGSASRSGLLSVLAASFVVLALRPRSLGRFGKAALIVATILVVTFSFNIEFDAGLKSGRTIGPSQIVDNFQSALGLGEEGANEALQGTRSWRLQWWGDIINYTVFGEYFWTGKGFGVNLADDDGFQGTAWEGQLRNPHNVHLTILARAGVPGLAVWLLLQGLFGFCLVRAYLRARRLRQRWWAAVDLWILAYWTAFLVNASFDVYLEGPQAGIWFWSVFGVGLALMEYQRRLTPAD